MNKKLINKILTNNLLFIFLETIFLALVLSGIFDFLMPINAGAWISYEGYSIIISGTIITIILSYILAYKRYDLPDGTFKTLMKYYFSSFILLMIFLTILFSLPAYSPLFIALLSIMFFLLISFFVSVLTQRVLSAELRSSRRK